MRNPGHGVAQYESALKGRDDRYIAFMPPRWGGDYWGCSGSQGFAPLLPGLSHQTPSGLFAYRPVGAGDLGSSALPYAKNKEIDKLFIFFFEPSFSASLQTQGHTELLHRRSHSHYAVFLHAFKAIATPMLCNTAGEHNCDDSTREVKMFSHGLFLRLTGPQIVIDFL